MANLADQAHAGLGPKGRRARWCATRNSAVQRKREGRGLPAQMLLVAPCVRRSCTCCTGGCNGCLRTGHGRLAHCEVGHGGGHLGQDGVQDWIAAVVARAPIHISGPIACEASLTIGAEVLATAYILVRDVHCDIVTAIRSCHGPMLLARFEDRARLATLEDRDVAGIVFLELATFASSTVSCWALRIAPPVALRMVGNEQVGNGRCD